MKKVLFLIALLFLPVLTRAQVSFSEIMYDLDGGDTDREWVEVLNEGDVGIDISAWRLAEGEGASTTNHKLTAYRGDTNLPSGGYAVIASKPEIFLKDWPSFSGTLLGSSFSLKNTGEKLILRDGALKDSDTITYSPDWGAKGDGTSLQKVQGKWGAGKPTPGVSNSAAVSAAALTVGNGTSAPSAIPAVSSSGTVPATQSSAVSVTGASVQPGIRAVITVNPSAVAGGEVLFKGQGLGALDKPLAGARYVWNFGDGSSREGMNVAHIYRHPGIYVAVLDVALGEFSASVQTLMTVVAAQVSVSSVISGERGFVELFNLGNQELDLSFWQLAADAARFIFPKNTFVLAGKKVIFGNEATGLFPKETSEISLLYPNGDRAYRYVKTEEIPAATASGVGADGAVAAPVPREGSSGAPLFGQSAVPAKEVSSRGPVASFFAQKPPVLSQKVSETTENPDSKNVPEDAAAGKAVSAGAASSSGILSPWFLGAAGIVLLAIASVFIGQRGGEEESITIIE